MRPLILNGEALELKVVVRVSHSVSQSVSQSLRSRLDFFLFVWRYKAPGRGTRNKRTPSDDAAEPRQTARTDLHRSTPVQAAFPWVANDMGGSSRSAVTPHKETRALGRAIKGMEIQHQL